MHNEEKPQGLGAQDREIQGLLSTKEKEHSELTGITVGGPTAKKQSFNLQKWLR